MLPDRYCRYGRDDDWNVTWANTMRSNTDRQRCPGGVNTIGEVPLNQPQAYLMTQTCIHTVVLYTEQLPLACLAL